MRAADWLYREALSDGPNELGRTVARALAVCGGLANDASIDAVTRAAIEAARGYFVERTMERSAFLATLEDVTLEFTSGTEAQRACAALVSVAFGAAQPAGWRWSASDTRIERAFESAREGLTPRDAYALACDLYLAYEQAPTGFAAAQIVRDAGGWRTSVADALLALVDDSNRRLVKMIRKELSASTIEAAWACRPR